MYAMCEVMIVNGSHGRRNQNREVLERESYRVSEFINPRTAGLAALRCQRLAIPLQLPTEADGPARFVSLLSRHSDTRDIPVLIPTEREEEVATPVVDSTVELLLKPYPPRTLLKEIQYLTGRRADSTRSRSPARRALLPGAVHGVG